MNRDWTDVAAALLILVILLIALVGTYYSHEADKECGDKGGVRVRTSDGLKCLQVKPL